MAELTVGTPIKPERTTCCLGVPLDPLADDRWECPSCGCQLRASLSGLVPRGWRLVTQVITANCRCSHARCSCRPSRD